MVLEADVRLLFNPVFMRMGAVLLLAVGAFAAGVVGIRMLRRRLVSEVTGNAAAEDALSLHTSAIIQQLKQQKFTLEQEQKNERRRSKVSELITAAIMATSPCGLLFVTPAGMVKQANSAARQILGFAAPLEMTIRELFRSSQAIRQTGDRRSAAEEVEVVLQNAQSNQFQAEYCTPSGAERTLSFKVTPVKIAANEMLGALVAISDQSEINIIHRQQLLKREAGAEMALELRAGLSNIRDWADKMQNSEEHSSQDWAVDICGETERLEKVVGGFLAGRDPARTAKV
jgi:PAS domain-containing protein